MALSEDEVGAALSDLEEFPSGWTLRSIGSLGDKIKAGGTPSRSEPNFWNGDIPFAKIEDITRSGGFVSNTSEFITADGLSNSSAWLVPEGSVLLTMYGTIGVAALAEIPLATNQAILAIVPGADVDKHFLLYALWKWGQAMVRLNVQSTQKNIGAGIAKSFSVPVPPLEEQRAIAHVLRTVQRAKEQTEQVIAAVDAFRHSVIEHLIVEPDWPRVPLDQLCEKPQYGYTASATNEPVGPRFVRITDIQEGEVNWAALPFCDPPPDGNDVAKWQLAPQDILVARIGATTGKTFRVRNIRRPTVFASYLIRIRPRGVDPRYLDAVFRSSLYWSQINAQKGGRLKTGVNATTLGHLQIPIPDPGRQHEIGAMVENLDRKVAAEEQRKDALEQLFKTLLHELMTGNIRLTDWPEAA